MGIGWISSWDLMGLTKNIYGVSTKNYNPIEKIYISWDKYIYIFIYLFIF